MRAAAATLSAIMRRVLPELATSDRGQRRLAADLARLSQERVRTR